MRGIFTATVLALATLAHAQTVAWEAPVNGKAERIFFNGFTPFQLKRPENRSLGIDLGLQNADIGQISVILAVVKAVAHDEIVRHGKAGVVNGNADLSSLGLIQQSAEANGRRAAVLEHFENVGQGKAAVQNVLNNDNVLACDIVVKVLENADDT